MRTAYKRTTIISAFAALSVTLVSFANADIIAQSDTSTYQFSTDFSAEWFTFFDETSQPKIRVKLIMNNVDATTWNSQGEMGYWIGIGFGSAIMDGSDIVICQFKNTG